MAKNSYTTLLCFIQLSHSYSDPLKEFSNHEVIVPKLYPQLKQNDEKDNIVYENELIIELNAFNRSFIFQLLRSTQLIPSHYFEKHHQNGSEIYLMPHLNNSNHCHYKGYLVNQKSKSWAAISTCNQSISGMFSDDKDVYYIHPKQNSQSVILFRNRDLISTFKCGLKNGIKDTLLSHKSRWKRYISNPYKSNSISRYIELVIVNDYKVFVKNKKSINTVFERSKRIANIINALFNQLNVFVVLVGVVVWTENNKIQLSSDSEQTLKNFLHYRKQHLLPKHRNDNSQLITGTEFDNGVVGKANVGSICSYQHSGGVNTDHSLIDSLVAATVAHELGHNLGMDHDSDQCKCPDEKCIMTKSSNSMSPTQHWSSCSVDSLMQTFKQGLDHCLHNIPNTVFGPLCGNGFVEEGEECDCGLRDVCDNPCCNATTCKLTTNAECGSGVCCDLTQCKIIEKSPNIVCREAKGICDLKEFCDGVSEFCPEDLKVRDGTQCVEDFAYCFDGKCKTRETQCRLLWGETGRVSDDICYQHNTGGDAFGNCGYFRQKDIYISCKTKDVMCGRLHCYHHNKGLEYGIESGAILAQTNITKRGKTFPCSSAMIDIGLDSIDPGLVPNGVKCGNNSMCVNQKCVSIESILQSDTCSQNCTNNGVCDNKGNCHCFSGSNCETSTKSDHKTLIFTILIIFLCILSLIAIIVLIYKYNNSFMNRISAFKTRSKQLPNPKSTTSRNTRNNSISSVNFKSIEISPPINIENGNNANNQLMPLRPAPPPPIPSLPISLNKSPSVRSLNIQITRPSQPPPSPPRPQNSSKMNIIGKNVKQSEVMEVSYFNDNKQFSSNPSIPPSKPLHNNINKKQTSVANLTKKFEKLNG